ncbi:hypothetical protein ABZP36_035988 [Zizania latifolia]
MRSCCCDEHGDRVINAAKKEFKETREQTGPGGESVPTSMRLEPCSARTCMKLSPSASVTVPSLHARCRFFLLAFIRSHFLRPAPKRVFPLAGSDHGHRETVLRGRRRAPGCARGGLQAVRGGLQPLGGGWAEGWRRRVRGGLKRRCARRAPRSGARGGLPGAACGELPLAARDKLLGAVVAALRGAGRGLGRIAGLGGAGKRDR